MKSYSIVVLLFFSICGSALADFREGYIITSEKDTLYGQVDYRSNTKNYKSCRFKSESGILEYSPKQIIGFGYLNDKYFTSAIIEDAFVEVLVDGELCLYKSNDAFLIRKQGEIYELKTKKIEIEVDGKKGFKQDTKWRGIITYLTSDCSHLFDESQNKLELNEKSLTKLSIQYNECGESEFTIYKKNKPWTKIDLGVSIGVANSTIKVNDQLNQYSYLDNSYSSLDPIVGILLGISSPRISEKISFQGELYYIQSSYSSLVEFNDTYRIEYHDTFIDLSTISVPLSLRLILLKRGILLFVQAGINYDYNIISESNVQSEIIRDNVVNTLEEKSAFEINESQLGYLGGIGILKSYLKFTGSISVKYFQMSNLNSTDGFTANNSRILLNLTILRK